MFGRTEVPQKGPQQEDRQILRHSNMSKIIEIIRRKRFCVAHWRHKVSSQVLPAGNWHTMTPCLLTCTTYVMEGPHIFFWTGPLLRQNPALSTIPPLILQGSHMRNVASIFDPVAVETPWFRNKATHLKSKRRLGSDVLKIWYSSIQSTPEN